MSGRADEARDEIEVRVFRVSTVTVKKVIVTRFTIVARAGPVADVSGFGSNLDALANHPPAACVRGSGPFQPHQYFRCRRGEDYSVRRDQRNAHGHGLLGLFAALHDFHDPGRLARRPTWAARR